MGLLLGGIDNAAIAELLVSEAERVAGQLQRAFRNSARKALLWPQEAADLEMTKPCIKKMALCLLARALEERR